MVGQRWCCFHRIISSYIAAPPADATCILDTFKVRLFLNMHCMSILHKFNAGATTLQRTMHCHMYSKGFLVAWRSYEMLHLVRIKVPTQNQYTKYVPRYYNVLTNQLSESAGKYEVVGRGATKRGDGRQHCIKTA